MRSLKFLVLLLGCVLCVSPLYADDECPDDTIGSWTGRSASYFPSSFRTPAAAACENCSSSGSICYGPTLFGCASYDGYQNCSAGKVTCLGDGQFSYASAPATDYACNDTCSNGQKDDDEEGVDCGGNCSASCQDVCPSPTELVDTTGSEACDILTESGLSCEMCFELTPQVNGECDSASWPTDSGECAIIGTMTSPFAANPDSEGYDEDDHTQPSQDPTETTDFGSDTTYDYSTTDNGDGSTTATETKTSTTTREDGVTKQETVTTSTTTNSDGSTTVIVTTQTNYSGGGGGSTTTSSTTTNYDSDGNVSGISTTGSGTATSSDYSPEDAELPTVNVNVDTSGIETRIDETNSLLDDLLEFFTFGESDKDGMLSDFDQGTSDLLDEAETEQQEFVDGIIEDTDFDTLPFEEDLTSEIEGLIPDPGVCTDIEIPFSFNSEYINLDYTFVIECEPFETYFKPVITWFFYGVTAIMAFYSFTAPVGEGK